MSWERIENYHDDDYGIDYFKYLISNAEDDPKKILLGKVLIHLLLPIGGMMALSCGFSVLIVFMGRFCPGPTFYLLMVFTFAI